MKLTNLTGHGLKGGISLSTKTALSIAGFDPSGGAGCLADIKAFHAHKVYGFSALTAITVQNSQQVYAIKQVSSEVVYSQLVRLFEDFKINSIKIGMLGNEKIVEVVIKAIQQFKPHIIVLDPVIFSSSGHLLLSENGQTMMKTELIPLTTVITPNLSEAEILSGNSIRSTGDIEAAAQKLLDQGANNVIIKGGHTENNANDFFLGRSGNFWMEADRIDNRNTHGTGCAFSSAIVANMALGKNVEAAVKLAKQYVNSIILNELKLGKGSGMPQHFF